MTKQEPAFDANGYPTVETLNAIGTWGSGEGYPSDWPTKLLDFAERAWDKDYGLVRRARRKNTLDETVDAYEFVAGGWSGNESIISALEANKLFWLLCWEKSERGGLYVFHVPIGAH